MPTRRVCFPFVGDSMGGSHLSALLLLQHLPESWQPHVVVHERGPLSTYFDDNNVAYDLLPLPRYVGRSQGNLRHFRDILATVSPLSRYIREHGIDILHPQDGRMNMTWMAPVRRTGRSLVWHQRSMYAPSRLTSLMLRGAHKVICVSRFVADSMPAHSRAKCVVIDDPHDTARTAPPRKQARADLQRELAGDDATPYIGFFANLTRQKRPDVLIEAAALVCQQSARPPLFLLFGRDYDGLKVGLERRADELGIAGQVRFMGFRSPAEPLMAACDIVAAPAVNDAFPRILIEAMQVGTPLVAARSGGHSDILTHDSTALLVEPDNPAALADGLICLLEDATRRQQLSDEARRAAQARYSIARHVAETTAIYADVLKSRRRM